MGKKRRTGDGREGLVKLLMAKAGQLCLVWKNEKMRVERKRTERRSGESGWDGELDWLAVAESRDNRKKMASANRRHQWRHTNPHGHPAPSTRWILYPSFPRAKYPPWGGKLVLFSGDIGIRGTYLKKAPTQRLWVCFCFLGSELDSLLRCQLGGGNDSRKSLHLSLLESQL